MAKRRVVRRILELPAGTIIHVNGFPFKLRAPTEVIGRKANFEMAVNAARPRLRRPINPKLIGSLRNS